MKDGRSLWGHLRLVHLLGPVEARKHMLIAVWVCEVCHGKFATNGSRRRHMMNVHHVDPLSYED